MLKFKELKFGEGTIYDKPYIVDSEIDETQVVEVITQLCFDPRNPRHKMTPSQQMQFAQSQNNGKYNVHFCEVKCTSGNIYYIKGKIDEINKLFNLRE